MAHCGDALCTIDTGCECRCARCKRGGSRPKTRNLMLLRKENGQPGGRKGTEHDHCEACRDSGCVPAPGKP